MNDLADKLTAMAHGLYSAAEAGILLEAAKALRTPAQGAAVPEGYVLVPRKLTAENGAKACLSGEFSETFDYRDEDGDDIATFVPVSWTTIKAIHQAMVKHFDGQSLPSTER